MRTKHSLCTFLFLVKLSTRVPHPSGESFVRHRRPGARLFHILHRMRCTVNASIRSVSITQPTISIEHLQIKPTIISQPLYKILNSHRKVIFVNLNDSLFNFYWKTLWYVIMFGKPFFVIINSQYKIMKLQIC